MLLNYLYSFYCSVMLTWHKNTFTLLFVSVLNTTALDRVTFSRCLHDNSHLINTLMARNSWYLFGLHVIVKLWQLNWNLVMIGYLLSFSHFTRICIQNHIIVKMFIFYILLAIGYHQGINHLTLLQLLVCSNAHHFNYVLNPIPIRIDQLSLRHSHSC